MSAPDANGWLPIESAPKDKSWLLIARGDEMAVGWFDVERSNWRIGGMTYFDKPTHWKHRPKPPVQTTPPRNAS